jgi:hypothetical protein
MRSRRFRLPAIPPKFGAERGPPVAAEITGRSAGQVPGGAVGRPVARSTGYHAAGRCQAARARITVRAGQFSNRPLSFGPVMPEAFSTRMR